MLCGWEGNRPVSALCLPCFDTDSWVARSASSPYKLHSINLQRFCSRTHGRGGPKGLEGDWLTQIHRDKQPLNASNSSSTAVSVNVIGALAEQEQCPFS